MFLGYNAPAFFESGVVFEDGTICQSAQLEVLSSAVTSCLRILQFRKASFIK